MEIVYTLEVLEEDTPVRGNALASGDAAEDKVAEDEILARLYQGDIWAWCTVRVIARIAGVDTIGDNYLRCCSYKDEDDFKKDNYEQMCDEAADDLVERLHTLVDAGEEAAVVLHKLGLGRRRT